MRERLLATLGATILRGLFFTIRLRVTDRSGIMDGTLRDPFIVCFWHNRILGITLAFLRRYPRARQGVTVLTSPSRDGEILARFVGAFGMGAVRGSSSRRGSRALLELIRILRGGGDVAITPDGPRGPRYCLGPGVIQLASTTSAPVVPLHASFSRALRLKTWDGFIIPLPFSTISVSIDTPLRIPADLSGDEFEARRKTLEDQLRHGAD